MSRISSDLQSAQRSQRLGFIGAGKLAGSVIRGLLLRSYCAPDAIIASEPAAEARAGLEALGVATTEKNQEVASSADIVFIGVKPPYVRPVLREIAGELANKMVVSFAAGVRLASMEAVADARLVRVMTNTPSAIGRGATGLAPGSRATADDVKMLCDLFSAIGAVVEITEDEIDAVTALAGSGPAFVYSVIEAFAEGAARAGLRSEAAMRLAAQMTLGAGELALTSGKSPEELRRMVVTPGGTTAAGLAEMEKRSASEALAAAVEAAANRGREMAEEFGG
jgi:pyrroline-5-carboxylate reductase